MPKKSSPPRLPPLSFGTLRNVLEFEHHARSQVDDCYHDGTFNVEAAIAILRTDILITLDLRIKEYTARPDYGPAWMDQIKVVTFDSMMANVGGWASLEQRHRIATELLLTMDDHLRAQAAATKQPEESKPAPVPHTEPLNKQIEDLRIESRLTVEQLADEVNITPRSLYRHLSGKAKPRASQIAAYEKLFSSKLGKPVRLKTSG